MTRIVAVEAVCPPGDRYTPAPLGCLTLFLTRHGRAEITIGAQTFPHHPGALVAAASGCRIVEQVAPEQPWTVSYLQLAGPWAEQMDAWLRRQDPALMVWPSVSGRRRQVFTEMVELALTQADGWPWLFLSRCAELLGGLYSDSLSSSPGDALLQQISRLLGSEPAERPSVAQMAAAPPLTKAAEMETAIARLTDNTGRLLGGLETLPPAALSPLTQTQRPTPAVVTAPDLPDPCTLLPRRPRPAAPFTGRNSCGAIVAG